MEAVPQPTASGGAGSTVAPRLREGGDGRAVSGGGGPSLWGRLGAGGQQTGLPTWPCGRGGAPAATTKRAKGIQASSLGLFSGQREGKQRMSTKRVTERSDELGRTWAAPRARISFL